jgi:alpha 1,2-mannosyltransferase
MIITGVSSTSLLAIPLFTTLVAYQCPQHRPSVKLFCDIDYDPFLFMQEEKKVYGSYGQCVPKRSKSTALWLTSLPTQVSRFLYMNTLRPYPHYGMLQKVRGQQHLLGRSSLIFTTPASTEFIQANPDLLPKDNAMGFISDDGGESYNRCHCMCQLVSQPW